MRNDEVIKIVRTLALLVNARFASAFSGVYGTRVRALVKRSFSMINLSLNTSLMTFCERSCVGNLLLRLQNSRYFTKEVVKRSVARKLKG